MLQALASEREFVVALFGDEEAQKEAAMPTGLARTSTTGVFPLRRCP